MQHVAIVGAGATGTRIARQVARSDADCSITLVDAVDGVAEAAASALGGHVASAPGGQIPKDASLVVLATRAGTHAELAQRCLPQADTIVSVADSVPDVRGLLDLDDLAQAHACKLVVGAGMMPGLTDILAAHGSRRIDDLREIHVSKFGTGGPDCARQHHRALKGLCYDWRGSAWNRRPGGSGRELAWFPPPVQAADCYRAALADPLLLVRMHPNVERITSRLAATRRDRLTMHLPMLRRPHPEGLLGAVRVELRGTRDGAQIEIVLGVAERPAVAAGAVAATAISRFLENPDEGEPGSGGLAEWVDSTNFLHRLRDRGLRPEIFIGADETY
ncbi:MAG: saccharopine dehydrogenase-like NADP-dependent oxidoreductase [Verrucomicrobiales bacterium]|jgi:saccharopine dehydrogenase-like NADP-dependent oxidoreductase